MTVEKISSKLPNLQTSTLFSNQIQQTFQTAKVSSPRDKRLHVEIRSDLLPPLLSYAKTYLECTHFSHMSCVDWIEDKEFELVYILWSYEKSIQLIIKTRIPREKAEIATCNKFWPQISTYEREIHEMFGVKFNGNDAMGEFILEDWDDMPPMRRDFDTEKYARENFAFRDDRRDDAIDVRENIMEHSGEELPDFAEEYSVRKKD
ncbi:MAG: NADH-quinone oxidoreductase subunit C [Candidatus Marinimicrobia bacterium]|nr:NADH-quinone oxidoreductase subunit C [Candidatus Neomarinimicrobiota bacterium]